MDWQNNSIFIILTKPLLHYHTHFSLCASIFMILLVIQRSSLLHCNWYLWLLVSGFLDVLYLWIGRNFSFIDILSPFSFVFMCLFLLLYRIIIAKRNRHIPELTTFTCTIYWFKLISWSIKMLTYCIKIFQMNPFFFNPVWFLF